MENRLKGASKKFLQNTGLSVRTRDVIAAYWVSTRKGSRLDKAMGVFLAGIIFSSALSPLIVALNPNLTGESFLWAAYGVNILVPFMLTILEFAPMIFIRHSEADVETAEQRVRVKEKYHSKTTVYLVYGKGLYVFAFVIYHVGIVAASLYAPAIIEVSTIIVCTLSILGFFAYRKIGRTDIDSSAASIYFAEYSGR